MRSEDLPTSQESWHTPQKRPNPRRKINEDERSLARAKGKSARKARKASRP